MTITNGYATLAQLQTKIGDDDSTLDTLLENSVEDASRIIDEITNTFFYTKTLSSEKVDRFMDVSKEGLYINRPGDRLYFPAPIISITTLTEDGVSLTEDTDFTVYETARYIDRESAWSSDRKAIIVSGTIGYASTPGDIRRVCLELAGALSGKETRAVLMADGSVEDVIKNNFPKWVWKSLQKRKVYTA